MLHWKPRALALRVALPAALLASAGAGIVVLSTPAASDAAVSGTQVACFGNLSANTSQKLVEPDLLNYTFSCSAPITAYSVIIDRTSSDGDNVDDYNPNPLVYAGTTVDGNTSVQCYGVTPSNGINCISMVGSANGPVPAAETIDGTIDPTASYCAYEAKGAKPGTATVPRAIVELVVTDSSGNEDGPFELKPTKACAKVPAVVPEPKSKSTTKKKTKTKSTSGSTSKVKKAAVKHA